MGKRRSELGKGMKSNGETVPFPVVPPTPVAPHFGNVPKYVNIPTVWADTLVYGVDKDAALVMFRFFTLLDDAGIEVARVQMRESLVKDILDRLSCALDHYPTRPMSPAQPRERNRKRA